MRRDSIVISTAVIAASALLAIQAQAEDRYGPSVSANAGQTTTSAATTRTATLSWPGKKAAQTPAPAPPPATLAEAISAPATQPASIYAPPPGPPSAAPAARPEAQASTSGAGQPPRFYSVHRPFGLTPDPIPLSPQFFADSGAADLAAPPPPLPPRAVPGSQAVNAPANTAANRAREVALDTPSPDGGGVN